MSGRQRITGFPIDLDVVLASIGNFWKETAVDSTVKPDAVLDSIAQLSDWLLR